MLLTRTHLQRRWAWSLSRRGGLSLGTFRNGQQYFTCFFSSFRDRACTSMLSSACSQYMQLCFIWPLSADPLPTGTEKISSPGATDDFSQQCSHLPLWRQSRDEFWLEMRPGPPLSFGNDLRYLPHLEPPTLVKPQSLQSYKQPLRFRFFLFYFGW